MKQSTIKGGWKFSSEMKPDIFSYDKIFFDLIIDNKIHEQINELFGKKMYLFDIHLKIQYPLNSQNELGYTGWHVDTNFYYKNDKLIHRGLLPTCHKLIIYPRLTKSKFDCFKIIPDSFTPYKNNGYNIDDYNIDKYPNIIRESWQKDKSKFDKYLKNAVIKTFKNSNDHAYLFDSSLIHTAVNSKIPQFRIIYWFASEEDLEFNKNSHHIKEANSDILKKYKNCLNNLNDKEFFDRVISLGNDCAVAGGMRNIGYKEFSYPFDWNFTNLKFIIESFNSKLKNFQNIFDKCCDNKINHFLTYNNDIYFYHDRKKITNSLKLKYQKRSLRLHNLLNENKKILFVRKSHTDKIEDIKLLKNTIIKNYPNLKFKILFINNTKLENFNDDLIICKYKDSDCFIYLFKEGIHTHTNKKKAYNCVSSELNNFKSIKFKQPKNRDDF